MSRSQTGVATQVYNPADARTQVALAIDEKDRTIRIQQRAAELKDKNGAAPGAGPVQQQDGPIWELILYVGVALTAVFGVTFAGLWFLIRFF